LISSFSDNSIKVYCSAELTDIYVEQGIQYAIIAASGITNFLFGFIVDKIVNFTRPSSQSSGLLTKTVIFTIFLIFNTIFLPILIYADILGFKATNYISFITIISSDVKNFLNVDSITFYVDFEKIWYRNVSPIFTNYLIFDTISVWVFYILGKCSGNQESIQDEQGKILQKNMNKVLTSYQLNVYK
jgi:hypothetical protein